MSTIASGMCGNGFIDEGEDCDDGNSEDGDECPSDCQKGPFCGDGIVDEGEECDDGNMLDGDGCSLSCKVEVGDPAQCEEGTIPLRLTFRSPKVDAQYDHYYLIRQDESPDQGYIWSEKKGSLKNDMAYRREACLDKSGCYSFHWFDETPTSPFGEPMILMLSEYKILYVDPSQVGERWFVRFGSCPV